MAVKKKTPAPPAPTVRPLFRELLAIGLFFIALFIWIALYFPHSTGALGYWVIEVGFNTLFGNSTHYFPYFLTAFALLTFFDKHHNFLVLGWGFGLFLSFTLILEIAAKGFPAHLLWPYPGGGGGYVGHFYLFGLYKLIGRNGVYLLLLAQFICSPFILSHISPKEMLVRLKKRLTHYIQNSHNPDHWWYKTIKTLFFTSRWIPIPVRRRKAIPTASTTQLEKLAPAPIPKNALHDDSFEMDMPIEIPISEPEEITVTLPQFKTSSGTVKAAKSTDMHYQLPELNLLAAPAKMMVNAEDKQAERQERAMMLEETLQSFNVDAKVVNVTPGPSVTRYELKPGEGVKISKITALSKDISLKLAAPDIRIEAPIPGKALVGIEVPNKHVDMVNLRTIIDNTDFSERHEKLLASMGLTITGESILMDLGKMPHVLIAGATGSGKSVCVNAIIMSILLKATPNEVKFLMIDPKKVELSLYEGIPHLVAPVVTDPHKAAATLKQWALVEMEKRYDVFSKVGVKSIDGFNALVETLQEKFKADPEPHKEEIETFLKQSGQAKPLETVIGGSPEDVLSQSEAIEYVAPEKLPYIVVIIDELADLMMVASHEVETTICRLAQMARATGIHLVIATQRPSVNVITGLIKANVPSRVSFYLQSQIDSRTILDMAGAEKLLGKGDMLYSPVGSFKPRRVQGVFVSEKEVKDIVSFWKNQGKPQYDSQAVEVAPLESGKGSAEAESDRDSLYEEAKNLIMNTQYASTSYLQRKLKIGYNRAARIMDELTEDGIVAQYANEKKPLA